MFYMRVLSHLLIKYTVNAQPLNPLIFEKIGPYFKNICLFTFPFVFHFLHICVGLRLPPASSNQLRVTIVNWEGDKTSWKSLASTTPQTNKPTNPQNDSYKSADLLSANARGCFLPFFLPCCCFLLPVPAL